MDFPFLFRQYLKRQYIFFSQVAPSPATGSKAQHNKEQNAFITDAMTIH